MMLALRSQRRRAGERELSILPQLACFGVIGLCNAAATAARFALLRLWVFNPGSAPVRLRPNSRSALLPRRRRPIDEVT